MRERATTLGELRTVRVEESITERARHAGASVIRRATADTDDDPLRTRCSRCQDELAGAARRCDARIAFLFSKQRQPARRRHLEHRRDAVTEHAPLRVDLASERIVNASAPHLATGRPHEGKRRPLSPIGEWKLDAIRAWPDAPHAARDSARDGDRVGTAFERLGSDHHPRRAALGHAGMIDTMRTFFRRAP
jgi:hypothetical protein